MALLSFGSTSAPDRSSSVPTNSKAVIPEDRLPLLSHYDASHKAYGNFLVRDAPSWLGDLKMIPGYQLPDFWV